MTNPISAIDWNGATAAVEAAQKIVVVTHVSPDGDAIGSLLGVTNALRARGKKVDAVVDGGVPDFLQFMPGSGTVRSALNGEAWDLMISVDASDEPRTGEAGAYARARAARVINLDHHATNTGFGHHHLVDAEAASATEVVYNWLRHMGQSLTRDIAVPLLVGLATDTIGFRTSNVRAETLEIVVELMRAGASLTEITARTLDSKSYKTILLWKNAFGTVTMQGDVITGAVARADWDAAHFREATDGGLVQVLITVNEAMIAVVFKELADGRVEISMRSKPGYNVADIAFSLGGGGHVQASGATIDGPLEAAQARVLPLAQAAARAGKLRIT